jgi:hypothetical protein
VVKRREHPGLPRAVDRGFNSPPVIVTRSDKFLLAMSCLNLLLAMVLVVGIALLPGIWRKASGFLGVISLAGNPTFLVISLWESVRYGRNWRTMMAVVLSLIGTILAWGVTVMYALGIFGFGR